MIINKLKKIKTWNEIKNFIDNQETTKLKGDIFEALTKYYLMIHPTYKSQLENVWIHYEVPEDIKEYINLPDTDEGIDLIAKTFDGKYWTIQCKYLGDENSSITEKYISTFLSLSSNVCKNIDLMLTTTTANNKSYKFEQKYDDKVSFLLGDIWSSLDESFFMQLHKYLEKNKIEYNPFQPKKHQIRALTNANSHFIEEDNERGKLIMACGSGKSLTAFWIAQKLNAKKIIVALPSLALVKQTLDLWTRESLANKLDINWIVVCSDESVSKKDEDVFTFSTKDLGIEVTTNIEDIKKWIKNQKHEMSVVFTTYASGNIIAKASREANYTYDFGIFDEAHKTTGVIDSLFSHLLFDENIKIKKRLFMTATEKTYKGISDEIASMDNPNIYGEDFEILTFKEALETNPPILCDYQVIAMMVTKKEISDLIENNNYVRIIEDNISKKMEANLTATAIVLHKAIKKFNIKHTVSFHGSINRAKYFKQQEEALRKLLNTNISLQSYHISGNTPTATRNKDITSFATCEKGLITNARCLTEGVDVPNIDSILFADPRQSTVDIVQAVGRAIRLSKDKEFGYVLVPIIIDDENINIENVKSSSFDAIINIVKALSTHDERIIDLFNTNDSSKIFRGGGLFQIDSTSVDLGSKIDINTFAKDIQVAVLEKTKGLKNRPFEDAREFVRSLDLTNLTEWKKYCKGELKDKETKPFDIPSDPQQKYKLSGWKNIKDWLGTTSDLKYLSFEEAREYARSLNLKNVKDWTRYILGKIKSLDPIPDNIPKKPNEVYRRSGFVNMKDWIKTPLMPFKKAKEFALNLKLKGTTSIELEKNWRKYCNGEIYNLPKKPNSIPNDVKYRYRNEGWKDWSDWLKGETKVKKSFEEARDFARSLGLTKQQDWKKYCKSELEGYEPIPLDIPTSPAVSYEGQYKGIADWLGYEKKRNKPKKGAKLEDTWMSFEEAKEFTHSLKLKSSKEWKEYCEGKIKDLPNRPINIPKAPNITYKSYGISFFWSDWLGESSIKKITRVNEPLPFEEAKEIIQQLNLNSEREYKEWKKNNNITNLPSDFQIYRKDSQWEGIKNFLGK